MTLPTSAPPLETGPPAPRVRRKIRWICALAGAWAILIGFAAFVLLQAELAPRTDVAPGTREIPRVTVFLLGLLVAALVSFVAEYLHDRIEKGERADPVTLPRVLMLMLLLAMFEIFASAGYEVVTYFDKAYHEGRSVPSEIRASVGQATTGRPPGEALATFIDPIRELLLLGGLWAAVAALLGLRLTRIVLADLPGDLRSVGRGIAEGLFAGVILAPGVVVGYWLAVHLVIQLHALGQKSGRFWPLVLLAVVVALAAIGFAWWRGHRRLVLLIAAATLGYELIALDLESDRLWKVALLTALVWSVPGLVLGGLAPLFRARADEPKLWGILATGTAILLVVLTWSRLENPVFYGVAVGVLSIGLFFFFFKPEAPLVNYWPLAAIAIAAMVTSVMMISQYATFLGVFAQVHAINNLPSVRPSPLEKVGEVVRELTRWPPVDLDPQFLDLTVGARGFSRLSRDRQLARLNEIEEAIRRLDTRLRAETATHYRTGRIRGVIGPSEAVERLYRDLADAVEMPDRQDRLQALLARAREIEKEEAGPARGSGVGIRGQLRAMVEAEEGGPEVRQLAADLYQFARRAPGERGDAGARLLARADALLKAGGYVAGEGNLPPPRSTPFDPPVVRRITRLIELRTELVREMTAPGTGTFLPPRPLIDDPPPAPPGLAPFKSPTPLYGIEHAKADIERELEIAKDEKPLRAPIGVASPGLDAHAVVLTRLGEARRQLAVARIEAKSLHDWLTGTAARHLELALVGSFGFWMTVGLLVAWKVAAPPDERKGE